MRVYRVGLGWPFYLTPQQWSSTTGFLGRGTSWEVVAIPLEDFPVMGILFPCGCLSKVMGLSCWVFNLFSLAFFVQIADILRDWLMLISFSFPSLRSITKWQLFNWYQSPLHVFMIPKVGLQMCKKIIFLAWTCSMQYLEQIIVYLKFKFNWVCPLCVLFGIPTSWVFAWCNNLDTYYT